MTHQPPKDTDAFNVSLCLCVACRRRRSSRTRRPAIGPRGSIVWAARRAHSKCASQHVQREIIFPHWLKKIFLPSLFRSAQFHWWQMSDWQNAATAYEKRDVTRRAHARHVAQRLRLIASISWAREAARHPHWPPPTKRQQRCFIRKNFAL